MRTMILTDTTCFRITPQSVLQTMYFAMSFRMMMLLLQGNVRLTYISRQNSPSRGLDTAQRSEIVTSL